MPLLKKASAIVSFALKIEESVKQLLEDCARFIDSTPDHVANIVIKKSLWRDQDYRKWREQHRAASPSTNREPPRRKVELCFGECSTHEVLLRRSWRW